MLTKNDLNSIIEETLQSLEEAYKNYRVCYQTEMEITNLLTEAFKDWMVIGLISHPVEFTLKPRLKTNIGYRVLLDEKSLEEAVNG